ncbi:MAG TPA: segregation/condensation protein A [Acidobacteriota bacterium]|nr:segregation/condensation protein A [Acidobacteriota bacterium]
MTPSQDYKVQLEVFEGPLDLLLHLIRTQEIDIYDIPIARITDQYLQYLQMMRDLSINVAGEFLVMAATLIYIKSRMLLPAEPAEPGEEIEDPRKDLVQQLLEHEKFKNAAQLLYARETVELSVWGRGENEFAEDEQELVAASVFDLVKAFHIIMERYKDQIVIEVTRENVTIEDKIAEIRKLLAVRKDFYFSMFFQRKLPRLHLVVTVLALLELVKQREIRIFQKGLFEDIRICAC